MKIVICFLIVLVGAQAKAQSPINLEPSQPPIHVSESGKKYWPCNGNVADELLEITAAEMAQLSSYHGLPVPDASLCLYNIGNHIIDTSIKMYGVDYYVSEDSMTTCLIDNYCDNFRSVHFFAIGEEIKRQYLLSSVDLGVTHMACVDWSGEISNPSGGCME